MDNYEKQKKSGGIFLGGGIFLFFIGVASTTGGLIFFGLAMIAIGIIILRQIGKTDSTISSEQEHIDRVVHTYTYDPSKQKPVEKKVVTETLTKEDTKPIFVAEPERIEPEENESAQESIPLATPQREAVVSNSPYKNESSFQSSSTSSFNHQPMFSNEPMFKDSQKEERFQDRPSFTTEPLTTKKVTFASSDGKRCYNCHELNEKEAVVCEHCGTMLAHECKNCGAINDINARFCQSCGRPLV